MPDVNRTAPRSHWGQILVAHEAYLRNLNIDGLPLESLRIQKLPYNLKQLKPGLFVSPGVETLTGRGNASDIWAFPTQITYVATSNGSLDDFEAIDAWLYVRQRLFEEMLPTIHGILAGIEFAHSLELRPGPVYDAQSFEGGLDAQAIVSIVSCSFLRKRHAQT